MSSARHGRPARSRAARSGAVGGQSADAFDQALEELGGVRGHRDVGIRGPSRVSSPVGHRHPGRQLAGRLDIDEHGVGRDQVTEE